MALGILKKKSLFYNIKASQFGKTKMWSAKIALTINLQEKLYLNITYYDNYRTLFEASLVPTAMNTIFTCTVHKMV